MATKRWREAEEPERWREAEEPEHWREAEEPERYSQSRLDRTTANAAEKTESSSLSAGIWVSASFLPWATGWTGKPFTKVGNPGGGTGSRTEPKEDNSILTVLRYSCNLHGIILYFIKE